MTDRIQCFHASSIAFDKQNVTHYSCSPASTSQSTADTKAKGIFLNCITKLLNETILSDEEKRKGHMIEG